MMSVFLYSFQHHCKRSALLVIFFAVLSGGKNSQLCFAYPMFGWEGWREMRKRGEGSLNILKILESTSFLLYLSHFPSLSVPNC